MKTTCILMVLCGVFPALMFAQSNKPTATVSAVKQTTTVKATATKPAQFPTVFTNSSGVVYRDVKFQQAYSYGIGITYVGTNKMTGGAHISYDELSPEWQKRFGYDPKKASASTLPKSSEQLRREYNDVVDLRRREAQTDEMLRTAQQMQAEQARIAKENAEEEERRREIQRQDMYEMSWKAARKAQEDQQRAHDIWRETHPDYLP